MRKIIFASLFCALSAGFVSAQIGVNFGYSSSSIKDERNAIYSGFNAGASYDLPISEDWTMLTGLNYSRFSRTFIEKKSIGAGARDEYKYTFQYLEIPIQAAYNMQLMDNFKIFAFAGPKLVYNLAGTKSVLKNGQDAPTVTSLYEKGQDRALFNAKLGFGFGAQYLNFRLKTGYDWGLLNQYTGIEDNKKYSRKEFFITLGYVLKIKK
jgi:hypothetical protein